ncbi:PfkB family carbohydrate kinase [Streptomyces lunaelactis]|uniref:PfkB family carbohydrate kinase n=1 Tax=Streptomyces lunaelactis TaxID=1535768 RepID=UPI0020C7E77E|nr:PfkB family carbohydrate kinase [Streptomyces lunaelactis]
MYASVRDDLRTTLDEIRAAGLYKPERVIGTPQSATVSVASRDVLNFCANNYLGLADHPEVVAAAKEALDRWGYGMASVRFICGTQDVHKELEARLSAFLGQEDTILYSSCFDANGGVFETILGPEDAVISDALNHASIIDGIRLCKARRHRYANRDLADLEHCEAFLPNAEEAMRYTRTECPRAAARALTERVPLAIVTLGAEGAYAVDGATGESAQVPAIAVEALDPTGAGDVFVAGFVTGTLAGWPLADRLAFGGLTAALSVQEFGGSLSAPGWSEVAAWWQYVQGCDDQDPAALRRYAFLEALLPAPTRPWPLRRAVPTIGFGRSF